MKFIKKFFIILIIIFISITFIDCISVGRKISEMAKESGTDTSDYNKQLSELEKSLENLQDSLVIESAEEEIEEEKVKEIMQDFYVGESLSAEDFCEFAIHGVENYKAKSEHMQPKGDFRLIAFDVEIKNISNEEQNYSISNYEAQDSDGYVYESTFYESKEPCFGYGDISSGQNRRGWVTVPVKDDAEIVAIIAQPLYQSSPITIKLYTPLKP